MTLTFPEGFFTVPRCFSNLIQNRIIRFRLHFLRPEGPQTKQVAVEGLFLWRFKLGENTTIAFPVLQGLQVKYSGEKCEQGFCYAEKTNLGNCPLTHNSIRPYFIYLAFMVLILFVFTYIVTILAIKKNNFERIPIVTFYYLPRFSVYSYFKKMSSGIKHASFKIVTKNLKFQIFSCLIKIIVISLLNKYHN